METQRQSIAEDCHTITRRSQQSKKSSENGKEDTLPLLPTDLILEIFSRLPSKSIGMFCCVSKLLASVLSRPYFTDLFSAKSSARPRILLVCRKQRKTYLFSLSQPQKGYEHSSPLVVDRLTPFPFNSLVEVEHINVFVIGRIGGFLGFVEERCSELLKTTRHVIYNPLTGRSLTLPKVGNPWGTCFDSQLVYDPVEDQFKILSMTSAFGTQGVKYKVLTLGTENAQWRRIECGITQEIFFGKGICINGVLYYQSVAKNLQTSVMICFDVRHEKFSSFDIKEPYMQSLLSGGTLIDYNDKLALLQSDLSGCLQKMSKSIELIVIGDFEKQEWSKHTYLLPSSSSIGDCFLSDLNFVGVTQTNEIVLRPIRNGPNRFCIFLYNMERCTFTKVEINGMNVDSISHIFLDYVEDLTFIGG